MPEESVADLPVACATCGATPEPGGANDVAFWSRGVERDRPMWTCPACSRQFVRGIEGKLDSEWW